MRADARFRNWITPDGAPGPTGEGGFKAEPGRYHLYVSLACPWANRTLIFRALKGLEGMIGVSVTHWLMVENGWTFAPGEGVVPDTVNGVSYLHQLYAGRPAYTGRATVPVLWDKQRSTIVSDDSSEIIRMLNSAFDGVGAKAGYYYPEPLRARSMPSTRASTTPSTTACTRRASPPPRRPTRTPSSRCSIRWTGSRSAFAAGAF